MVDDTSTYNSDQIVLFADFDSANMARYEKVLVNKASSNDNNINLGNKNSYTISTNGVVGGENDEQPQQIRNFENQQKVDAEYNVWTRNDCQGTQYSNGNRTWFYFGVRGGYGKWVKFNIMNLNRQGRLFEMGMLPVFKTVPGHEKWSRVYSRPTWQNTESNFQMSFCFHLPDKRFTITYFAFCYPFSYEDCQTQLSKFDKEFEYCKNLSPTCDPDLIYYHRELFCYSLDSRRVDLLTISGCSDTNFQREPRFDKNLFPDAYNLRPYNFDNKRVFILTSRVHPGETPASFVFNGFLEFILNRDDPRAKVLRRNYVFKLIPLLNPDGVARGHYRTDQLGMNLNRVYLDPSFSVHPAIYAAKSLVVYHHIMNRVGKEADGLKFDGIFYLKYDKENYDDFEKVIKKANSIVEDFENDKDNVSMNENSVIQDINETNRVLTPGSLMLSTRSRQQHYRTEIDDIIDKKLENLNKKFENLDLEILNQDTNPHHRSPSNCDLRSNRSNKILLTPIKKSSQNTPRNQNDENETPRSNVYTLRKSHDFNDSKKSSINSEPYIGNENSDEDDDNNAFMNSKEPNSPHLNDSRLLLINPLNSGIGFYVDLHGHAAKRGCFIYGNSIENEEYQIDNVLFAKLISLNSQHFDFDGCNFTVKNMYYKDKREGLSKEGSGRVALYKATGIIHSYTLECNYACGRVMNTVASAANSSLYNGRISPPTHTELPPKFQPEHYQNVGKGLAIAALDIAEINPCTRVNNTTFGSLEAVRNWVKFYIRTKLNSTKKFSITQTKTPNKSGASNNSQNSYNTSNSEYRNNNTRRNTAPTSNSKTNEISRKNFFTQLSQPNNLKTVSTIGGGTGVSSLRDGKNDLKFLKNNKAPPVSESKNFIRKSTVTPQIVSSSNVETKKTKLVEELIASSNNNDEDDFRAFNNFIHKIDGDEDDKNSEGKEELITMEEIDEVLNEYNNEGTKVTNETAWFLKDTETNAIEKTFDQSKPNSRLQKLNNISSFSPVREILPMGKAIVSHNEAENILTKNQLNLVGISSLNGTKPQYSLTKNSNNNSNTLSQQNKFLTSKQKSKPQTIKAVYSTNLIKKLFNANNKTNNKSELKAVIGNSLSQEPQDQQQQETPNNDNNSKKRTLIEYKNKYSNRKAMQPSTVKNLVMSNDQVTFDNKKLKRKRMKEQARKLKLSLPNIEKYDTPVKINEVDDVTAFWIDL